MSKSRRITLGLTAAALALAVLATPALARLWVDLRWFETMGHPDVLLTPLWARLALGVAAGASFAAVLYGNLRLAVQLSVRDRQAPVYLGEGARTVALDLKGASAKLVLPVSLGLGILVGLVGAARWREWLLFAHGEPFGEVDALFGRDVGFYVFTLPFLDVVWAFLFWATLLSLAATFGLYVARGSVSWKERRPAGTRAARVHLSALGAALFGVLAFGAWLASAQLVISQEGLVAGAGYTDVNARLPLIQAQLAVACVSGALVLFSATRRRLVLVWAAIGLYLAVGVLGRGLYPTMVQTYVVEPNELERERPFIETEIEATRAAFGLSGMETRELSGELGLSLADVEANRETIDNIRLWDHRPLLDTFGQIQEIRTYYDFVSVDNDRYVIDGELRQTMLSPRELSSESLPNRTWINEHFTFTHGYGVTLGPVNRADDEGLPVLFVQDIPPVSSMPRVEVTRPQIYFGELSNDYAFVGTANREFDHPSAEANVYADYEGRAGVRLDSRLLRAALAIRTGEAKVLFSDDLSSESRVLLHRRVEERVAQLAPFLALDADPYLVVREDGTLAWIVDAYTTSDRYPYSRRAPDRRLNYVRNSVKVVVDAYDGTVTLYVADEDDPILATWRRIFPRLFTDMDEMPADLRRHLRYPIDVFHLQAQMLSTFHMDSPELLYNREDQWEIPSLRRGQRSEPMEPYYTVMRLPGEEDPEFILMLPFTPARKDNLAAWMVARNDGAQLGQLRVYEFPNDRLVYGPQQVLNRINQDAEISQQLSLWDQRGSQADFGTLLVIPIEESLIYVLPLYLRSEGGRIPQLKRVIVVHENRIAMAETLDLAIAQVFGQAAPVAAARVEAAPPPTEETAPPPAPDEAGDPRVRALRHFEEAVAAQRRGDWARYGEEIERVEAALRAMQPSTDEGETGQTPDP